MRYYLCLNTAIVAPLRAGAVLWLAWGSLNLPPLRGWVMHMSENTMTCWPDALCIAPLLGPQHAAPDCQPGMTRATWAVPSSARCCSNVQAAIASGSRGDDAPCCMQIEISQRSGLRNAASLCTPLTAGCLSAFCRVNFTWTVALS